MFRFLIVIILPIAMYKYPIREAVFMATTAAI
jgi:hypothetical protein